MEIVKLFLEMGASDFDEALLKAIEVQVFGVFFSFFQQYI